MDAGVPAKLPGALLMRATSVFQSNDRAHSGCPLTGADGGADLLRSAAEHHTVDDVERALRASGGVDRLGAAQQDRNVGPGSTAGLHYVGARDLPAELRDRVHRGHRQLRVVDGGDREWKLGLGGRVEHPGHDHFFELVYVEAELEIDRLLTRAERDLPTAGAVAEAPRPQRHHLTGDPRRGHGEG